MNITNNKNCNIKINDKSYNDISAEEMFKKLGYDRRYASPTVIDYCYGEQETYNVVRFHKNSKHIELFGGKYLEADLDNYEYYENDYKLFIAINKQVEELGWNK